MNGSFLRGGFMKVKKNLLETEDRGFRLLIELVKRRDAERAENRCKT